MNKWEGFHECVPDGALYLSNPPQLRCKICGKYWFFQRGHEVGKPKIMLDKALFEINKGGLNDL